MTFEDVLLLFEKRLYPSNLLVSIELNDVQFHIVVD